MRNSDENGNQENTRKRAILHRLERNLLEKENDEFEEFENQDESNSSSSLGDTLVSPLCIMNDGVTKKRKSNSYERNTSPGFQLNLMNVAHPGHDVIEISSDNETPTKQEQKPKDILIKKEKRRLWSPDSEFEGTINNLTVKKELIPLNSPVSPSCHNNPSCSYKKYLPDFEETVLLSDDEDVVEHDGNDYYNDILNLPVWSRQKNGLNTLTVVDCILKTNASCIRVAKAVPYDISENVAFLISSTAIGHWKNTLSDGMGVWKNTGIKTKYVSNDSGKLLFVSEDVYGLPYTYKVMRTQFINQSETKLHKVLVRMNDWKGHHEDLILVQYYFEGEEKK